MSRFCFIALCLFAGIVLLAVHGDSTSNEDRPAILSLATVSKDVPQKWKQVIDKAKSIQCRYTVKEIDLLRNNSLTINAEGEAKASANWFLHRYELQGKTSDQAQFTNVSVSAVAAINSKYAFSLRKQWGNSKWTLKGVEMLTPSTKKQSAFGFKPLEERLAGAMSLLHFCFPVYSMAQLLQKKETIRFHTLANVPKKPGVVRINFDHLSAKDHSIYGSGWVELNSNAYWCVDRYSHTTNDPTYGRFEQTGYTEYTLTDDAFPLLKRFRQYKTGYKDGKKYIDVETTIDAKSHIDDSVPEWEFTLSAFDMPEPGGVKFDRPRPYRWFYIGGGVCLSLGLVLFWLVRRKKPAPADAVAKS